MTTSAIALAEGTPEAFLSAFANGSIDLLMTHPPEARLASIGWSSWIRAACPKLKPSGTLVIFSHGRGFHELEAGTHVCCKRQPCTTRLLASFAGEPGRLGVTFSDLFAFVSRGALERLSKTDWRRQASTELRGMETDDWHPLPNSDEAISIGLIDALIAALCSEGDLVVDPFPRRDRILQAAHQRRCHAFGRLGDDLPADFSREPECMTLRMR